MTLRWRIVLCAGVLVGLVACEGGGPAPSGLPTLPDRTGTGLPTVESPTRTRPTVTLPTRSDTGLPTQGGTTQPPTQPPTTQPPTQPPPTTERPTTEPPTTQAPTTAATTTAVAIGTTTPAPTTATSTPAGAAAPESSSSSWVWWLLGGLAALAALATLLVVLQRRQARQAWDGRFAGGVAESTWLARGLVPAVLGAENPTAGRAAWMASRPRVETLESGLAMLAADASEERAGVLERLRYAVGETRAALDGYVGTAGDAGEQLGMARQAQRQLEEALRASQPAPTE